jgi:large subunit ribosomal protein L15
MKLHELAPADGSKKNKKRVGRGNGSGSGKTAGKGHKGQNSRSGGGVRPGFEGGQMPIHRRLPKRGFTNIFKKNVAIINIADLEKVESGSVVDESLLIQKGLIKGKHDAIKLLGKGDISFPVVVKLNGVSTGAREKIEAAGGTVEVV